MNCWMWAVFAQTGACDCMSRPPAVLHDAYEAFAHADMSQAQGSPPNTVLQALPRPLCPAYIYLHTFSEAQLPRWGCLYSFPEQPELSNGCTHWHADDMCALYHKLSSHWQLQHKDAASLHVLDTSMPYNNQAYATYILWQHISIISASAQHCNPWSHLSFKNGLIVFIIL